MVLQTDNTCLFYTEQNNLFNGQQNNGRKLKKEEKI